MITHNEWADFWRDDIGMNVIPAISRDKKPIVFWKEFQTKPIPQEIHNQWKNQGLFENGMALIMGKIWHRSDRSDYYLACIDIDNQKAIQELFTRNGKQLLSTDEFATKTIVEQHKDNPNRLHFYVYTVGKHLRNKSSDIGHLAEDVDPESIPCFEVKATSGLLSFPCPGIHKDGYPIEILGTREPVVLADSITIDDMQQHLDLICSRFNLGVGGDHDRVPISELFKEDTVIYEGHNRHEAILRVMESLLRRNAGILSSEQIEQLSKDWNSKHCSPPLDEREYNKQWKSATDFISKTVDEHQASDDTSSDEPSISSSSMMDDYDDMLIDEYYFKTMTDTDEIWFYDNQKGIFVPDGEPVIKARLEDDFGRSDPEDENAPPRISNNGVKEHIGHVQRRTYINREDFNPDIAWIACNNCMINLLTGEIEPFDPKFLSTTKIPVNYDSGYPAGVYADFFRMVEGEEIPRIMKFFYEIMDAKDVELFLDYLAYCLWREYRYNFWMLLVGKGFNGKSILLDLIERFIGKENKSGETLHRLLDHNNRFSVANLYNKMVNVDADVSADTIFNNTGILKKLTGNDLQTGEHKFKKPFYFRNNAKLFFSCNKIPETDDDTDAFFRRIFIINFTQQFFGEKDDPHLIDKISTENQLSILLSELLSRLPRIVKCGLRQVTNEALEETYDKFTRGSDPVKYFYEKALQSEAGNKIPKIDMYEDYTQFCQLHRLTPESDQSFSRKLTQDYHLKIRQYRINGERVRCWVDVRRLDWQKEIEQESIEEIGNLSPSEKEALR